jgi:hypothetical protein
MYVKHLDQTDIYQEGMLRLPSRTVYKLPIGMRITATETVWQDWNRHEFAKAARHIFNSSSSYTYTSSNLELISRLNLFIVHHLMTLTVAIKR